MRFREGRKEVKPEDSSWTEKTRSDIGVHIGVITTTPVDLFSWGTQNNGTRGARTPGA